MGSGHSYEKEFRESQETMERMRREADAAEERIRVQQERERAATRERLRMKQEMDKLRADMNKMQEEKDKVQAEKNKVQKEKNKALAQKNRVQKEKRDALAENLRIQAEVYQKELERVKKEKEQLEETLRVQAANKELEERLRKAEEENKMATISRRIQEEATQRVQREIYLREEAERNLRNGIPAVEYPTGEDIRTVRSRLQYKEGNLHLAITGVSGSGKSSLVNAFRGFGNTTRIDPNIARVGIIETTGTIERYCDPVRPWLIWYDVPGAGTLNVPSWQYFNNQGLYSFDAIIIVIDIRFTKIDVELLFNCKRFGIPAFVVRSKADQHIRNMGDDDSDDDEGEEEEETSARNRFIKSTRQEFRSLLESAGLPQQDIYIVCKKTLQGLVRGDERIREEIIDETDLMNDVICAADERHNQDISQRT